MVLTELHSRTAYLLLPLFALALAAGIPAAAQEGLYTDTRDRTGDLQQLTGYVYEDSTDLPLSYSHILNLNKRIGKVAALSGYFSIVASPGDTLFFSSVGYHDSLYIVREADKHLVIHLRIDIRQLPETEVGPWPRNMLALRQDMRLRRTQDMSTDLVSNMSRAGFRPPPAHPTPPPPTIMNPISFIYERVFKKIQERRPKKDRIDELPPID